DDARDPGRILRLGAGQGASVPGRQPPGVVAPPPLPRFVAGRHALTSQLGSADGDPQGTDPADDEPELAWRLTRSQVLRDSMGVAIATGAYGISFGAIAVAGGLDFWQTMALSLLMFTGGSQFGLIGVVAGGGAPLAGAATAIM